jgi:hypothetical protein
MFYIQASKYPNGPQLEYHKSPSFPRTIARGAPTLLVCKIYPISIVNKQYLLVLNLILGLRLSLFDLQSNPHRHLRYMGHLLQKYLVAGVIALLEPRMTLVEPRPQSTEHHNLDAA